MCSPLTILINIHLSSVSNLAHFMVANEFLSEYYPINNQLKVINMPFNVLNGEGAEE